MYEKFDERERGILMQTAASEPDEVGLARTTAGWTWTLPDISFMPVQIFGLALGSMGTGGMLKALCEHFGLPSRPSLVVAVVLWVLSAVLSLLGLCRVARMLCCERQGTRARARGLEELTEPATISAWSCLLVVLTLITPNIFSAFAAFGPAVPPALVAAVVVAIGMLWALYLCIVGHFLLACVRTGTWPEPLFFPATVGLSMAALTLPMMVATAPTGSVPLTLLIAEGAAGIQTTVEGAAGIQTTVLSPAGADLVETSFWMGCIATLILLPVAAFRVLFRSGVAMSPSAFVMSAPCSFMGLTIFCILDGNTTGLSAALVGSPVVIFVASQVFFWLAVYSVVCVRDRRDVVVANPLAITWVSFTFPVASSITTMLKAVEFLRPSPSAPLSFSFQLLWWYATLVSVVTAIFVIVVVGSLTWQLLKLTREAAASSGREPLLKLPPWDEEDSE